MDHFVKLMHNPKIWWKELEVISIKAILELKLLSRQTDRHMHTYRNDLVTISLTNDVYWQVFGSCWQPPFEYISEDSTHAENIFHIPVLWFITSILKLLQHCNSNSMQFWAPNIRAQWFYRTSACWQPAHCLANMLLRSVCRSLPVSAIAHSLLL